MKSNILKLGAVIGASLLVANCGNPTKSAQSAAAPTEQTCGLSVSDQLWVDTALAAWEYTNTEISKAHELHDVSFVTFDTRCQLTSATALSTGSDKADWKSRILSNGVRLPDGKSIPAAVTSFAGFSSEKNVPGFFVMAAPSVWKAAAVAPLDDRADGLELLMTAVMLHEATHAVQAPTYGALVSRLFKQHGLPEDFNDDSIQGIYSKNIEFSDAVADEIAIFESAAAALDDGEARRLIGKGVDAVRARQRRWFSGKSAKYAAVDEVFLTMEGSGQWVAVQWLADSKGGGLSHADAVRLFGNRGGYWSQTLGFAMFEALDRVSDDWKTQAFGDGGATILTMLENERLKKN